MERLGTDSWTLGIPVHILRGQIANLLVNSMDFRGFSSPDGNPSQTMCLLKWSLQFSGARSVQMHVCVNGSVDGGMELAIGASKR
jgi:hypothetical protein